MLTGRPDGKIALAGPLLAANWGISPPAHARNLGCGTILSMAWMRTRRDFAKTYPPRARRPYLLGVSIFCDGGVPDRPKR
jgi:hypothetical protein